MYSFKPRLVGAAPPKGIEELLAADIMKSRYASFRPDMMMEEAVGIVLKAEANGGPVTNLKGEIVGFLSERDCLRLAMASRINNVQGGLVRDFMRTDVVTVRSDESLLSIVDMFIREWYHLYPVVEGESNKLVGVITRAAVLEEVDKYKQTTW